MIQNRFHCARCLHALCLALSIRSLLSASRHATRESAPQMCMLQVSREFLHARVNGSNVLPESPASFAQSERPFLGSSSLPESSASFAQSERALVSKAAQHKQRLPNTRFLFFAQHKSGSLMTLEAATQINFAIENLPGLLVDFSHTMGSAVYDSEMQTAEPTCLLHVARNPFELVVSGYLYHKAQSEDWLDRTFDNVTEVIRDTNVPGGCGPGANWICPAFRGLAQVLSMSRSGPVAGVIPEALGGESFPEYLRRVDTDAGLIAEAIWASNFSLASMRFTSDFVHRQACSQNVCHNEFYENCNATWERVLHFWEIKDPHYSVMLEAAKHSCPNTSPAAREHSSHVQLEKKNLAHVPEHKMVQSLRELDERFLNGTLASLEAHLGERHANGEPCRVVGKYLAENA